MATTTLHIPPAPEQPTAEQWERVAGYPGYRVSTTGRIQSDRGRNGAASLTWRDLKPVPDGQGYPQVRLYKRGQKPRWFFISVLVLEAFVGPRPSPQHVARHVHDRDPWNNHVGNLAWGSQVENCADKIRHGTDQRGDRHWRVRRRSHTSCTEPA